MRQHVIHERMKYWAMALLLAATSGCAQHTAPTDHLETGQPFPALNVSDLDGQAAVLAAERGKRVVLNVWATWCAACRKELPSLERLSRDLDERRFLVVGLFLVFVALVVWVFFIDKGVTYANYMDPSMHTADNVLGVKVYPYTFFIGPRGEMLGRVIGTAVWVVVWVVVVLVVAFRGVCVVLVVLTRCLFCFF